MSKPPTVSSSDISSSEAIKSLLEICFHDAKTVLDPTYGKGNFWDDKKPTTASDRNIERSPDVCADFTCLPFINNAFDVVVFDPPFQPSTVDGRIGQQYSKPVDGIDALRDLVIVGVVECLRVSRLGIIVKCQDYIHNHKPVWMSFWLYEALGTPYEFMTARSRTKLIANNWGKQKSVYRNHSTYWVWRTAKKLR